MSWILAILTHILLLAALLALIASVATVIMDTRSDGHRILLVASIIVGFFLYISGKAVGLSIPELLFEALDTNKFLIFGVLGGLVPGLVGFATAWWINLAMKKKSESSLYWILVILTIITTMFGDLYLAAAFSEDKPRGFNSFLAPNIFFVLTAGIYLISNVKASDLDKIIYKHK